MKSNYFDKNIKVEGGATIKVPFTPIKDLFSFKAQPPIVVLGPTKGGKTVIALDVMYQFARQAHYVYYVSETAPSILDPKMSIIPSYFMRKPKEDGCYDMIKRIWHDITSRGEAMKAEEQNLKPILGILFPGQDIFARLKKHIEREELKGAEASAACSEIISRLIIDKVNSNPEILKSFNEDQLAIINGMMSASIKTLLIFDDVTSILRKAQQETGKVAVGKSSTIRKGDAMKNMLEDMFTRARHYNCIILMFVHKLDAFDSKLITAMTNFIFLNANAALPVTGLRRMSAKFLNAIIEETQVFDSAKYPYHVLFCDIQNRRCAVTCAEMHDDKIPVHPDVARFHQILDSIQNGAFQPSTIGKKTVTRSSQQVKAPPPPTKIESPKLTTGPTPKSMFIMQKDDEDEEKMV